MSSRKYDVVVIGAGPGGYVAAIRAAQLGLSTAIIEKEHLGGVCLNWGCIPTKAMLRGAEIAHTTREMARFGFTAENVTFDIKQLVKHSRDVAARLSDGVDFLMKKHKIDILRGSAKFMQKGKLQVQGGEGTEQLGYTHCVIATGASPRLLPGLDESHPRHWTYYEAMVPSTLPESILVVGAGAIGCEFASLYADLGSEVTLVEMADQILPAEDQEVSSFAQKSFASRGIDVRVAASVQNFDLSDEAIACEIVSDSNEIVTSQFDVVITAVGVKANVEGIGLETIGVQFDNGWIKVDEFGCTNVAGIYAIGDVAGPPCLAHKASHEAIACIEKLGGVDDVVGVDRGRVPACTYTRPQIASVGLTEADARAAGHSLKVGKFSLSANGKAIAIGDDQGFVKTIFDSQSGELLGAHMIGPEVTEQIHGPVIAQALETTEHELIHTIFPHPTISEAIHEAVLSAERRAIHN